ncbi:unnamed protein product [Amoebophrya sp. A25]|nr:unnamed protein product [Amoebophrya sp. A25]|eukprot:GSA25T00022195001.1
MWCSYVNNGAVCRLEDPAERAEEKPVQLSLGAEHGILLSDQGRVYTWGDNRYGQLGRRCVKRDEGGRAFVVGRTNELGDKEAVQVCAGKHFCLVLCAMGEVYAWGRNKQGQLGLGHYRDTCKPTLMTVFRSEDPSNNVVRIGAGVTSAFAVTREGSVYQWGSMLQNWADSGPTAGGPAPPRCTPLCVMRRDGLTRGGSRGFSVFEADGRVGKSISNEAVFREQLAHARQCQATLGQLKHVLEEQVKMQKIQELAEKTALAAQTGNPASNKKQQKAGVAELNILNLSLEQEVAQIDDTISVRKQEFDESTQMLAHLREQLHKLDTQTVTLGDQLDALTVLAVQASGIEQRKLQERVDRVQEYQDANSNAKLAILDQRGSVEKKRVAAQVALEASMKQKEELQLRRKLVHDFGREMLLGQGQPPILAFVTNQLVKLTNALDEKSDLWDEVAPESYEAFVSQRGRLAELEGVEQSARSGVSALDAATETEEITRQMFLGLLSALKEFLHLFKKRWDKQDPRRRCDIRRSGATTFSCR